MVMQYAPLVRTLEHVKSLTSSSPKVIYMSPQGRRLDQINVRRLSQLSNMILLCGRYEGIDERFINAHVDEEWSIGDYVLSGGELPALVLIEALSRMIPGVIGDFGSVETDSHYDGILGPPQYTRPAEYSGMKVPDVLMSGDHGAIARWRRKEALRITRARRPDLLVNLEADARRLLDEIEAEELNPPKEIER